MCWFSVNLLFRAIHNGISTENDLWEERIILINSGSEIEARNEGLRIGKSEEHEYLVASDINDQDGMIRWSFIQIERICKIESDNLVNGQEIFTRYLRNSEVESILIPFD